MRHTQSCDRIASPGRLIILLASLALSACAAHRSSLPGAHEPHHHLRFQNGYVRVMETRLEPGEETLLHSHPIEAAVVFLTDAEFRISDDSGSIQEQAVRGGDVAFGDSAIVHRTANIGETTARVVTVEIFSLQPPAAHIELPAVGETLLDNAKARLSRVRATRGRSVSFGCPTPAVVIAETAGVITTDGGTTALKPGDARWCEPGSVRLHTSTDAPFQVVVVMLKPRGNAERW